MVEKSTRAKWSDQNLKLVYLNIKGVKFKTEYEQDILCLSLMYRVWTGHTLYISERLVLNFTPLMFK